MAKPTPFLSETNDRQKAFPIDESFEVVVKQDEFGMFDTPEWRRISKYEKSNIPRYASCTNKRCQQGGIDLQMQVMHYPADGKEYTSTYSCTGHEGTPQGRRMGAPCMNSFTVAVTKTKVPTA